MQRLIKKKCNFVGILLEIRIFRDKFLFRKIDWIKANFLIITNDVYEKVFLTIELKAELFLF